MPDYLPIARDSALYDIKFAGNVGNGQDDSALINAYLATVPPGSLVNISPPRVFYGVGASPIILPANLFYQGPLGYWNGTLFKQLNGANLPAVLASSDWYNNSASCGFPFRMQDVAVDGNSANNTTSHGLALTNFNTIIERCSFVNPPGAGILVSANTRNNALINNGLVQTRIKKCVISNPSGSGIAIADSSHGKVTDGYLQENQIDTPGLLGVIMDTAGGWRIEGNHVNSPQQDGIIASHCFNTFLRGNYIDGFGFNPSASPGTFYNGILAQPLAGGKTIVSDNIVQSSATVANTTYNFVSAQATDNTGTNDITVHSNLCKGANVANQFAFSFDGHLISQPYIVNEWANYAFNFPAANLYSINTNVTFQALQSQCAVKPNNSSTIFSGTGVPAVGLGANGDFYFRTDTPGTANQRLYVKSAGAWSGIL